ncbi:MAG: hypothetical protein LBS53_12105 [Synergistaceae bacterium]|nr:hypothetical protein [Synergistaceae bacterium]
MPYKRRDIVIIPLQDSRNMVLACDSCGGLGLKEGDVMAIDPYFVGKFTVRVALLEVMASGARPIAVSDGLCCEMNPTGRAIVRGIEDEIAVCGLKDVILTGSTEENFPASMTGVGITVLGCADKDGLRFGNGRPGDIALLAGKPAMGSAVDLSNDLCYANLARLLDFTGAVEIVPVGSKGILYEANMLAGLHGLSFKPKACGVDLSASAGPATCIVAICRQEAAGEFPDFTVIGAFE